MSYGKSLRAALEERGMTQKRLAALIGFSPSKMSRMCAGKHEPDVATLLRVEHELTKVPALSCVGDGTFAGALRGHMHANKLTCTKVAELAGMGQPHISRLRAGELSPNEKTMRRVAKALGRALTIGLDAPNAWANYGEPDECPKHPGAVATSAYSRGVFGYTVEYSCGCERKGKVA